MVRPTPSSHPSCPKSDPPPLYDLPSGRRCFPGVSEKTTRERLQLGGATGGTGNAGNHGYVLLKHVMMQQQCNVVVMLGDQLFLIITG